jgi:hypothetical protein
MKEFVRKNLLVIVLAVAGAAGGFLYWKFIGCQTGTCPIKSKWYLSSLWGLAFGYLAGSIIKDIVANFRKKSEAGKDINW